MRINKKCENCAAMQMQNTITHFLYAISKESYGKSHISTVVRNVGAHVRGNCSSAVSESLHGSRSGNHQGAKNISVNIRNKFITIQIGISIAMICSHWWYQSQYIVGKNAQTLCYFSGLLCWFFASVQFFSPTVLFLCVIFLSMLFLRSFCPYIFNE